MQGEVGHVDGDSAKYGQKTDQKLEEAVRIPSCRFHKEHGSADTLISGFWHPELYEKIIVVVLSHLFYDILLWKP